MHRLNKSHPREAGTDEAYRSFWQQSLDRLAEYLKKIQQKENKNGRSE